MTKLYHTCVILNWVRRLCTQYLPLYYPKLLVFHIWTYLYLYIKFEIIDTFTILCDQYLAVKWCLNSVFNVEYNVCLQRFDLFWLYIKFYYHVLVSYHPTFASLICSSLSLRNSFKDTSMLTYDEQLVLFYYMLHNPV